MTYKIELNEHYEEIIIPISRIRGKMAKAMI
jgi:hypothetical protein